MEQDTSFKFGDAYCVMFVSAINSGFYRNAAFQIILSENHDISVIDENDNINVGRIVLIKSLTPTKIQCSGPATHIHLSPRIRFSLDLTKLAGSSHIQILTSAVGLPFKPSSSHQEVIDVLEGMDIIPSEGLDPRLMAVLDHLSQNLDHPSIKEAARRSGLSRSRVRTLAREQMGVPLSTWVTFRKIVEANKALSKGASLSEAAMAGSFADQAHLTRTMRKMFGVTPAEAKRVYT